MGYDMQWIDGMSPSEEAEYVLRRDEFDAAVKACDAEFPREPGLVTTRLVPIDDVDLFLAENPDWAPYKDDFPNPPGQTRVAAKRFVELQTKVSAAYTAMNEANRSYYRLNVWGMGEMRELMTRFGMLVWREDNDTSPEWGTAPDWPDPRHFGLDPDGDDIFEVGPDHPYNVALRARLEWNPHPERGMAGWKFTDNSGWRVMPTEIHAALGALDLCDGVTKVEVFAEHARSHPNAGWNAEQGPVEVAQWFDRWVQWLREAEQRGGIEVY